MGINIKSVQAYLIDLSLPFASEERFLKNKLDKKQIHPVKKFKNAQKTLLFSPVIWNAYVAWKTLKCSFLYFWKSGRWLNFLSKKTNLKSIGIFSIKLEPKYEAGAASSSTSFQNSNGDQHQIRSSSFKQVTSSLSFRRKLIT